MEASLPPPGWYQDPQGLGQRYWDGSRWTERQVVPGQALPVEKDLQSGLKTAGFILAVVMPIFGFIIGIVLLAKERVGPGLAVMATSVLAFLVWFALLGA